MSRRSVLTLALIVLSGFGVRIAYLLHATSQPRDEWVDPDHYRLKGLLLPEGADGTGWQWMFEAVRHSNAFLTTHTHSSRLCATPNLRPHLRGQPSS